MLLVMEEMVDLGGFQDLPQPLTECAGIGDTQTGQNHVAASTESGFFTDAEVNIGKIAFEGHPNDLLQRRRGSPIGRHRRRQSRTAGCNGRIGARGWGWGWRLWQG